MVMVQILVFSDDFFNDTTNKDLMIYLYGCIEKKVM